MESTKVRFDEAAAQSCEAPQSAAPALRSLRGSPPPAGPLPVPLIVPKYQKKTRTHNEMVVTDRAGEAAAAEHRSPADALRQRSVEALTVRTPHHTHEEAIRYHSYAVFRHGRQFHSASVGYSSDGDLVLWRSEVAEPDKAAGGASSALRVRRVRADVTGAVCLNPQARRGLSEDEAQSRRRVPPGRLKKYPGVKCPKNRRIRNRLMNDHFATAAGRRIYEQANDGNNGNSEWTDDEEADDAAASGFAPAPASFLRLLHREERVQQRALERKGVSPVLMASAPSCMDGGASGPPASPLGCVPSRDPNSAEARYKALPNRCKDELLRAVQTSEFMDCFVAGLEARFAGLIQQAALTSSPQTPSQEPRSPTPVGCGAATLGKGTSPTTPISSMSSSAATALAAVAQVPGESDTSVCMALRDGYGRLVCHGVALYYRLQSSSFDCPLTRRRLTRVSLPARRPELPSQTLLSFLKRGASPATPVPLPPMMSLGSALEAAPGMDSGYEDQSLTRTERKKQQRGSGLVRG